MRPRNSRCIRIDVAEQLAKLQEEEEEEEEKKKEKDNGVARLRYGGMLEVMETMRQGNAAGRATRDLIVVTAERLFAEKGVDGVSLRQISQAADQGNIAAVQFHFGSKSGLVRAILLYRAVQTDASRHRLLDKCTAHGSPTVSQLVEALVLPVAEHVADPEDHYVSFQARLMATAANYGHPVLNTPQSLGVKRLQTLMIEVQPNYPAEVVDRRLAMIIEWMVQSMASYERSVLAGTRVMPLETAVAELVELLSSALRAHPV